MTKLLKNRKRRAISDALALAKSRDGRCLSIKYKKTIKLLWECSFGHQWYALFDNIRIGRWCPECKGVKKRDLNYAKLLAAKYDGYCLSTEYVNNATGMSWQCKNGHSWMAPLHRIHKSWCKICATSDSKTPIEEIHKLAHKKDGRCLYHDRKNSKSKIKWQCKNGHVWEASLNKVKNGQWCKECYLIDKRPTIKECRKIAKRHKGKCLSKDYIGVGKKLKWQCDKGHVWETTFSIIKQSWCPICNKCGHKTQNILYNLLKEIFPSYTVEINCRKFNWLKHKKKMEIDYFITDGGLFSLAVEYDGIQHFRPTGFGGSKEKSIQDFKDTRARDQIKNELIKNHPEDVKYFIRIPYTVVLTIESVKEVLKQNNVPEVIKPCNI